MATLKSTIRYAFAVVGFSALVCGIWIVGRDGRSSLLAQDALDHEHLASATKAVSLNSRNPEAYYARASLYRNSGQIKEAITDLERAADLRSDDYFLRLELGYTRYQAGDISGATLDFEAATRLAPFYAQPRWYLGNMLLQAGRLDEGFAELRRAVKSDPSYLPNTIQLATEAFDGDPGAIVKALNPESSGTRLALARYFIQQANIPAAMELFRAGKEMPAADLRALLSELLSAKRFADAHEVWLVINNRVGRANSIETASILNGGFDSEIDAEPLGFDWQIAHNLDKVRTSLDSQEFHNGGHSLRVDLNGNSNPSALIISQLLVVEPGTTYRLNFAAQTKDMITGGLPIVTIADANDGQPLARSNALPEGTSSWRNYEVGCKTGPGTRAVIIGVQRGGCSSAPCPAFGQVWFDDFTWHSQ